MKQILFLIGLFSISTLNVFSQNTKISLALGGSSYFGELVEGIPTVYNINPAFSLSGSFDISNRFRSRVTISALAASGNDRRSSKPSSKERNLDFYSKIWDINLALEYDVLNQSDYNFVPYVFAGPGVFGFNPTTMDGITGKKVELQKWGTEGQGLAAFPDRKPYSLTQFNFGFGGGIRMDISDLIQVSGEIFVRYALTDYLDDISNPKYVDPSKFIAEGKSLSAKYSYRGDEHPMYLPFDQKIYNFRGNSYKNDIFYSAQIKITYCFGGTPSDYYSSGNSRSNRLKCPRQVL